MGSEVLLEQVQLNFSFQNKFINLLFFLYVHGTVHPYNIVSVND